MKTLIQIFIIMFIGVSSYAQTYMEIRKTDSSLISIPISEIDSIYYDTISTFTCGDQISDIDGNTYGTVQIGNQCWITENLRVTHYPNGDSIPNITDNAQWGSLHDNNSDDAFCIYDNDTNNVFYGALYTWASAMGDNAVSSNTYPSNVQGVCPDGWHMPSDTEWVALINYLGGDTIAGGKMKSTGVTYWTNPNTGATNSSGFSSLPNGYRKYDGSFNFLGTNVFWWSATESTSGHASSYNNSYSNDNVTTYSSSKSDGLSVRCVKD